ncbi:tRNA (adenosine(37)-N6)-threonylcarbamoyltransferase complex transferase subunit TsaD, partial [candidate division WWE3 bacterium]|nr:tRNA (adenosine(37)-N6)-threonylcarbamoyltransferase complex transferase subunit TsaD [candidate division WWE3 bacterium]
MKILGIESSCDETAAAIVEDGVKIISHAVATSLDIQSQYGGVVPEVAARKQVEFIIPVLKETFAKAEMTKDDIDAIAVTVGPGLMGSLLVGVETAKVLSCLWKKPLIPVNHLVGHIYSGWLDDSAENKPAFPLIALIASGGHTDLVLMKGHGQLEKIGQTCDDAVGEAFDKVAKMLDLGYPGGPIVERMAVGGDPEAFDFPRPMISSSDLDFSYSGLKTAVLYKVRDLKADGKLDEQAITDICASFQEAAFDVLVTKTMHAAQQHNVKSILVTGGVAASRSLKKRFEDAVATL